VKVQDLANRLKVEQQRLAISGKATKAQINAQDSRIQQLPRTRLNSKKLRSML